MLSEAYGLGLFTERDHLSLSNTLRLHGNFLTDSVTGARHHLHPLATASIKRLSQGVIFHKWLLFMLDEQLSTDEITEIISFVNRIGGFVINSRKFAHLGVLKTRPRYWLRAAFPSVLYRHPATIGSLFRSSLKFMTPVAALICVWNFFLYFTNLINFTTGIWSAISLYLLMSISLFAHELAHITVANHVGQPAVIVGGGLRFGVLHGPLTQRQETILSASGPLSGVTVSIIVGAIIYLISHQQIVILVAGVVSVLNLLSLLPLSSDGRSLRGWLLNPMLRAWSRKSRSGGHV